MQGNLEAFSKKNDWSYKRLRAKVGSSPPPGEVDRALEIIEMLTVMAVCGLLDVRYADETSFSLNPNIPYGWGPIGEQQGIKCIKGGNLNVFGLLDMQQDRLTSYTTCGRVDTIQVIEWLDDFSGNLMKPTVVILDNAPWHTSAMFMSQIDRWQDQNLFIFHLPTYSPHLNPVEIVWRMMKYQWLRPSDFESKMALHQRVQFILQNYQTDEFEVDFDKSKW